MSLKQEEIDRLLEAAKSKSLAKQKSYEAMLVALFLMTEVLNRFGPDAELETIAGDVFKVIESLKEKKWNEE